MGGHSFYGFVIGSFSNYILILSEKRRACQRKNQIWANTNTTELNAFFGILLLAGAEKRSDAFIFGTFFYKMSTFSINECNS
jgi:hypothetical protein